MKVNVATIVADPERMADVRREDFPAVIRTLGGLQAEAMARYAALEAAPTKEGPPPKNGSDPSDHWLDVNEASAVMGVSVRWLYRHSPKLPFAKKLGPNTLRFSENGLKRWVESRR